MKTIFAALALAIAAFPGLGRAQGDFPLALPVDHLPNAVSVGVGFAPDYVGADSYFLGAAPAASFRTKIGRFLLLGNYATLNVLGEGEWSFGPAAIYRFGRSDADIPEVAALGELDDTLELGFTFGYEFVDPETPVRRLRAGIDATWGVAGGHDGGALNVSLRGLNPLPWQGGAVFGFAGATYVTEDFADPFFSVSAADSVASGIPVFSAGSGMRDARVGFGIVQSLSLNWHVSVGMMYSRLLGDAADSPIVKDYGSANQFIAGVGLAYAWGF